MSMGCPWDVAYVELGTGVGLTSNVAIRSKWELLSKREVRFV